MGLYQAQNFCTLKENVNKVKSQPIERKKIIAKYTMNRRLTSRIYKLLKKCKKKKKTSNQKMNLVKKSKKDVNR